MVLENRVLRRAVMFCAESYRLRPWSQDQVIFVNKFAFYLGRRDWSDAEKTLVSVLERGTFKNPLVCSDFIDERILADTLDLIREIRSQ